MRQVSFHVMATVIGLEFWSSPANVLDSFAIPTFLVVLEPTLTWPA